MAKNNSKRLKKGDCDAALLRAGKLLKKLEKQDVLSKEDVLEVKMLNDIIRALTNLAKSMAEPAKKPVDAKKDAAVIERFLKRRMESGK